MQFTAGEIAKILKGTVEGNPDALIWKPCKIEEGSEGGITFLANPKYTHYIYEKEATAIIVRRDFTPEQPIKSTLIRVENPYLCVARLLNMFNQRTKPPCGRSWRSSIGRHTHMGKKCYVGAYAVVGQDVVIGDNVKIYPQAYIGDRCVIADNTIVYAGAKLYCDTVVGKNCIIHSGAVIGADGFGFAPNNQGGYDKIDQIGNVVIEDNVEIGANTCIDRATMGHTIIRQGTKLDNLCQLAHNVVIGSNTVMAAQSAVAGSGKVGNNCVIAGQVGIVGHIDVGDRVTIAAQSGVTNSVKSDSTLLGSPAIDGAKQKRNYVYTRNMEALVHRIEQLEKIVKEK
ncbi:MAG: UDP-3-O-(3-hydroxymyristoyl)glucosamine N-acyltransferase [Bacteroidales bacterium]|nr:UDP-3-O-(3-hydroxymyristoyl)glucosamine N-acyltransferase [Candidatus Colimorpha onthohippi]